MGLLDFGILGLLGFWICGLSDYFTFWDCWIFGFGDVGFWGLLELCVLGPALTYVYIFLRVRRKPMCIYIYTQIYVYMYRHVDIYIYIYMIYIIYIYIYIYRDRCRGVPPPPPPRTLLHVIYRKTQVYSDAFRKTQVYVYIYIYIRRPLLVRGIRLRVSNASLLFDSSCQLLSCCSSVILGPGNQADHPQGLPDSGFSLLQQISHLGFCGPRPWKPG